jgi:hypothetical protein
MPTLDRKLRVFLCHASQDKPVVRELYQRLLAEPWIDPWLDEEKLFPGQDWDMEIEKAVENADVVIAGLSTSSVTKEGYIQRELKYAFTIALEKPEETIFLIPLRFDDCFVPRRLRGYQYQDYFDNVELAFTRLYASLESRANSIGIDIPKIKEELRRQIETKKQEEENERLRREAEEKIRLEKQARILRQIEEQLRKEAAEKEEVQRQLEERERIAAENLLRKREEARRAREQQARREKEEADRKRIEEQKRREALEQARIEEARRQQEEQARLDREEPQKLSQSEDVIGKIVAALIIVGIAVWTWIEDSLKTPKANTDQSKEIQNPRPLEPAMQVIDVSPYQDEESKPDHKTWDFLSNASRLLSKIIIWIASVGAITVFIVNALSWFGLQRIELSTANWMPLAYAGLSILILKALQYLYINRFVGESGNMIYWSIAMYICQLMLISPNQTLKVLSGLIILVFVLVYSPATQASCGCVWPLVLLGSVAGFYRYFSVNLADPSWLILSNEFLFVFSGAFVRGKK